MYTIHGTVQDYRCLCATYCFPFVHPSIRSNITCWCNLRYPSWYSSQGAVPYKIPTYCVSRCNVVYRYYENTRIHWEDVCAGVHTLVSPGENIEIAYHLIRSIFTTKEPGIHNRRADSMAERKLGTCLSGRNLCKSSKRAMQYPFITFTIIRLFLGYKKLGSTILATHPGHRRSSQHAQH